MIIIREKILKWNRPESGDVKRRSWLISLIAQVKKTSKITKTPSSLLFIVQLDIWKLFHFNVVRALLAHVTCIVALGVRSGTFKNVILTNTNPLKEAFFKSISKYRPCGYIKKKDSDMKTGVHSWYDAGNGNNPCITVRDKRWKKCIPRRVEDILQGAVLYCRLLFLFLISRGIILSSHCLSWGSSGPYVFISHVQVPTYCIEKRHI